MARIVVTNNLTLDGVMQSPSHPDEDRRGGFDRGGWAPPYFDDVMAGVMARGIEKGGVLLFGRRTYEQFASYWPAQPDDDPFAAVLNARRKYVASGTLAEPLPWRNSTLLGGDATGAVRELKDQPGGDVVILGSGVLVRSLLQHDLIDEFVLSIHPLVLGSGTRLFDDASAFAKLRLVEAVPTTTGVVVATYERERTA